jgi:hypothetical protein
MFLLAACNPAEITATPTQTVSIDCEAFWKQEKTDETKDLAFFLKLEKTQYKPDELIFSILTLKNVGDALIWVNNRMLVSHDFIENFGEVYFVIIAPWGESAGLDAKISAGESDAKYFVRLGPNEVVETRSEGIMYYAFASRRGQESSLYFPEGKYCVWAIYHNQTDLGLEDFVWKGKIKSNFVEFEITE